MITEEIRQSLFELQDIKYRDFQAKLIPGKDTETMIGVRTPELRKLAKQMLKREDIGEFLRDLPHRYFDEDQLHAFIVSGIKEYGKCMEELMRFLPFVDNWATCDQMSPGVFKKHKPELLAEIREWLGQYGASLGGSITRKTDYLVTNDPNSGTEKNMKAKAVGALVISEEEFNHMVGWHYQDEETVTVPEWLTRIPDGAFLGNKNIKTVAIPESITRIGTGAFAYCESLEKVNIPKSVRWIDRYAFRGCKGLADQNGFVVIRGVLYDYFGNDRAAVIPDGVVRIQKGAFHNHSDREFYLPVRGVPFGADRGIYKDSSKLERIVIPDSVRWIEEGAFLGCKGIKAVIMAEGVAIMGESAFAGCSALLEISIPGSVKSIGERAFSDCTGLETIVISEGVEKLEK